jgi:23S rRNA pseudouridine1911/1915/1917 synthase
MNTNILYQDDDLFVIEKPSGMTVNKADTTKDEVTLQDWVETERGLQKNISHLMQKKENGEYDPEWEFENRAGIVHRLDKETSGIILVAKNVATFVGLQKQFKERTIQKSYIALAHGKILPEEGEITVPVGRLSFNRKRFGVIAGGREAVTIYKTLQHVTTKTKHPEILTLVELYPKTGRTHQIRVHLKYMNHPIVSDLLYAGRKTSRDDRKLLPRLFLHAAKITFIHPVTQKEMHFESPLPQELQNFLLQLSP